MQTKANQQADDLGLAAQEIITLCGGDTIAAIKSLLIANEYLEQELALAKSAISYGYSRGWHSLKRGPHV